MIEKKKKKKKIVNQITQPLGCHPGHSHLTGLTHTRRLCVWAQHHPQVRAVKSMEQCIGSHLLCQITQNCINKQHGLFKVLTLKNSTWLIYFLLKVNLKENLSWMICILTFRGEIYCAMKFWVHFSIFNIMYWHVGLCSLMAAHNSVHFQNWGKKKKKNQHVVALESTKVLFGSSS